MYPRGTAVRLHLPGGYFDGYIGTVERCEYMFVLVKVTTRCYVHAPYDSVSASCSEIGLRLFLWNGLLRLLSLIRVL